VGACNSMLRKLPLTPPDAGMYEVSGSLGGVVPGRRVVKSLEVPRVDETSAEGLAPLATFDDLETLERVDAVSLAPLARLAASLRVVSLLQISNVDLSGLTGLKAVQDLLFG
jgi:hypothetical protein